MLFKQNPQDILCPHFDVCSGCIINQSVDQLALFQEVKTYFKHKDVHNLHLITGPSCGWRCRAKLVVQGTANHPKIGLYKEHSHEAVDIPFCRVHHPVINSVVLQVKAFIQSEKIEPYNEKTGKGLLRYVQLVIERSSNKIQLTFVLNCKSEPNRERWVIKSDDVHSVWLNCNTARTNTIFGSDWEHVDGPSLIWETLGGVNCCFHPASFAQANLNLFDKMLGSIEKKVTENSRVAEFYAGVGVIGLSVARKSEWVKCCEITKEAQLCFETARAKMSAEDAEKISFQSGLAAERLDLLVGADVVIVDPPRKGLDKPVLEALFKADEVKTLIYISCGWKAFQRDCDALLENGWVLDCVEPYLFFPGSNHIELLAVFKKTKGQKGQA